MKQPRSTGSLALAGILAIIFVATPLLHHQASAGVRLSVHAPAIAGAATPAEEGAFDSLSIIKFFNWI